MSNIKILVCPRKICSCHNLPHLSTHREFSIYFAYHIIPTSKILSALPLKYFLYLWLGNLATAHNLYATTSAQTAHFCAVAIVP